MKTAEMTLAEMLGQVPSKTKLSDALESMSTQELADILRAEGMGKTAGIKERLLKPVSEAATKATKEVFKKHGPKVIAGSGAAGLAGGYVGGKMAKPKQEMPKMASGDLTFKEKISMADQWGRELARSHEKLAFLGEIVGYHVGRNAGAEQKERGEKYNFGGRQLASLLLPGGVGYQIGRHGAHHNSSIKKKKGKTKKSSIAKLSNPAIKGLVDVAKHMATKAAPMVGKATNAVMSSSAGRRAAVGAGVGALGGALKDPGMSSTGQPKSRLGGMVGGAALGAGAGLAAKPALARLGGMSNGAGSYIRNASMGAKVGMPPARPMLAAG